MLSKANTQLMVLKFTLTAKLQSMITLELLVKSITCGKICGLDAKQFGAGIVPGTITFAKAGTKQIERWQTLIGKQFTGITSFLVTLDEDLAGRK